LISPRQKKSYGPAKKGNLRQGNCQIGRVGTVPRMKRPAETYSYPAYLGPSNEKKPTEGKKAGGGATYC